MRQTQLRGGAGLAARALVLGVSVGALGACDSLLEVELPHILTDEAIQDISSAQIQVNSAQALFECGTSSFSWIVMGHEDIFESVAGVAGGAHVFLSQPGTGTCDTTQQNGSFFDQYMGTRQLISTDPAKLGNSGGSSDIKGIYDRLVDDGWMAQLAGGERLAATSAYYMAQALGHFGQFYCEGTFDGGRFMTGPEILAVAEEWVTNRALVHITNAGNYALPNGAATGTANAQNANLALRAQLRLAAGNLAGANADAATVLASNPTFQAFATRESGSQRRNKVYDAGTSAKFSGMIGVNDFWNGPTRPPNPATGALWPATIPFTGYIFLGIQPDGRTLEADNTPVRWAAELRASGTEAPVSLGNGAVADTRVSHRFEAIQGPAKREVPTKYTTQDADIPLVTWRELTLIRARFENEVNNNQAAAIALINAMRPAAIPDITGAYATSLTGNQAEMREVILEEARREFYGGENGRWYQWKIQNTDLMWFPRFQGFTESGYRLLGGVRLAFPNDEFDRNPAFVAAGGRDARGSGCTATGAAAPADVSERPVF
ncbi:MAG: hypothetical protein AB7T31_16075 [Gemmatimonadales bacterium]